MSELLGTSIPVFIGITVVLEGGAAWLMGQALGGRWRPVWQVFPYAFLLGLTDRFLIYALHPSCTISMHVMWGREKQNTVFAIGKSILNRSSTLDIGALCLEYGGGGHLNAGTCQVENEGADQDLADIVARITGTPTAAVA